MSTSDVGGLLELMWNMDIDLSMYLSGKLPPSVLIPRILEACRQIRRRAVDDTAEHQIVDLERVAMEFASSPEDSSVPKRRRSPGPDESQLMKGIYDLRAQLLKAHGSMH